MQQFRGGDFLLQYKRADILSALLKNKGQHETEYLELKELYQSKVLQILSNYKDSVSNEDYRFINELAKLPLPESHMDDYDFLYDQFKNAGDDLIELNTNQFGIIFRNKWDWASTFNATSTFYKASR